MTDWKTHGNARTCGIIQIACRITPHAYRVYGWNLSRTNSYMERFSLPYPHRYGFLPYPHDNPSYMESQLYVLTTPPPTDTERERERERETHTDTHTHTDRERERER